MGVCVVIVAWCCFGKEADGGLEEVAGVPAFVQCFRSRSKVSMRRRFLSSIVSPCCCYPVRCEVPSTQATVDRSLGPPSDPRPSDLSVSVMFGSVWFSLR